MVSNSRSKVYQTWGSLFSPFFVHHVTFALSSFKTEDGSAPPATRLDDGIFTSSEEGLPTTAVAPSENGDNITKALEKLESVRSSNDNEE